MSFFLRMATYSFGFDFYKKFSSSPHYLVGLPFQFKTQHKTAFKTRNFFLPNWTMYDFFYSDLPLADCTSTKPLFAAVSDFSKRNIKDYTLNTWLSLY
jgi:hypothetical protein